ncbi:MAG: hypothetical protein WCC30_17220 [Candidatus Dormiibacterota bacterium]
MRLTVDTLDLYTAEKLVAGKQDKLRAEAKQDALRAASAREFEVTEHLLSIQAVRAAGGLVRRSATRVWNGCAKGKAALGRASR